MDPIIKNILAVVAGIIIGSLVNMGIVNVSGSIIPLPEGINPEDINSLMENMHRFTPINFLMPFLAHAIGTLAGAFIAAKFSGSIHFRMALVVGFFFLLGGIASVTMMPAPAWFLIIDVCIAYIPMAWLGAVLAGYKKF